MISLRLLKVIVALAFLVGIVLVLLEAYRGSQTNFLALAGFLLVAWIAVFYFFIWPDDSPRSIHRLLNSFTYHVDLARQQYANDPRLIEAQVLKAFEKLHTEAETLLRKRSIRIAQVQREVMRFHAPHGPTGPRWRPPTLSELGYVLAAAARYVPGMPVLALYKYSGEERTQGGQIADTYTILKEGDLPAFSGQFDAKVHSPFAIPLTPPEGTSTSIGADEAGRPVDTPMNTVADSEHNVAYILSLLSPITTFNAHVLADNLRAMAALPADTDYARMLSPASVRSWQRSVLTERIGFLKSSLPLARHALRQEPHLMVTALADVYRNDSDEAAALSFCLASIADVIAPLSAHPRHDIEYWLKEFARLAQSLAVLPIDQPLVNPGIAYVDARGAEADAALLKRTAELTLTTEQDRAESTLRVHVLSHLTQQEFHGRLRGFRELNAGEDDQAVIHRLLQNLHEARLVLHTVDGTHAAKAKAFPRPAGHQISNELYCAVNAAGVDVEGMSPQARYVLWGLNGRALCGSVEAVRPLIDIAQKIRGLAADAATQNTAAAGSGAR